MNLFIFKVINSCNDAFWFPQRKSMKLVIFYTVPKKKMNCSVSIFDRMQCPRYLTF